MVQTAEEKKERVKERRAEQKAERAERRRMNSVEPGHCPKEGCGEEVEDMEDSGFQLGDIYGDEEFERRGQCEKCGTVFVEVYSKTSTHIVEADET